jgi:cytochrome P450
MRALSSKLRGCYKAMIRERRESLARNGASPDANLLNILLSTEDQGFEMSDEIIAGTLQVSGDHGLIMSSRPKT